MSDMASGVSSSPGYDVIGDIHGHAKRLEVLLAAMNYIKRDGVWTHPERTAAFVGDYIDRGPENLRTCRIVMAMVEAGGACAVMGNHDFNAVCLATPDPNDPGTCSTKPPCSGRLDLGSIRDWSTRATRRWLRLLHYEKP
jgi:hypothetical protein